MATKMERSGGYDAGFTYVARRVSVVRVTTYQGGAMRKHGSYRAEQKDPMLAMLDGAASVKARPMGAYGLIIRRKKGSK